MAPQTATSSIAMALAGKTASVDIPKPRSGFTAARDPSQTGHSAMLPTPPNSISPTLRPHVAFASRRPDGANSQANNGNNLSGTPPLATSHPDSDLDLGDALGNTGAITPAILAKYHLPEIMLNQGPLAIRHVMGYLTTSVPGFSRIPPAKARRLVVAALEGRGCGQAGGLDGDVIFEKVGWGRWDARRRGEPSRHNHVPSPPSSLPNSFNQRGVQIPSRREKWSPYGTSITGDSAVFSYTETADYGRHRDDSMLEDEADKMSLDGDENEYCSSEAPEDEIPDDDWGEEDVTDEEDWAQIGADALRARSLNSGSGFAHSKQPSAALHGGGPASSTLAKSAPNNGPIQQLGFSLPDGVVGDREERAAVEALLRLGSM